MSTNSKREEQEKKLTKKKNKQKCMSNTHGFVLNFITLGIHPFKMFRDFFYVVKIEMHL